MRDKLRQLDETYLDLVIGILLCGVLSAILGMIITRGDLRYLIGAIVGTIFALVMITTMMVSIQKSVQMDTHQASRNMIKSALIRYVATVVFGYMAYSYYQENKNELAIAAGALAVLFQPLVKFALGRFVWMLLLLSL